MQNLMDLITTIQRDLKQSLLWLHKSFLKTGAIPSTSGKDLCPLEATKQVQLTFLTDPHRCSSLSPTLNWPGTHVPATGQPGA